MARKHSKDHGGGPTRAIEALTAAGVAFTVHEYEHDPAVAQRRTGYVVGDISPFGQTTPHRLFIDSACLDRETMIVSGGRRGLSVELSPLDLVELTDAEVTDLLRQPRYNPETELAMREARDIAAGRVAATRYASAAQAFADVDDE